MACSGGKSSKLEKKRGKGGLPNEKRHPRAACRGKKERKIFFKKRKKSFHLKTKVKKDLKGGEVKIFPFILLSKLSLK